MNGVEPPRGPQRVGKLAAHLRDLPDRHEGGHGEEREQRQEARVEPPACRQRRARPDDGEPARAGGHLLPRGLPREVAEERQACLRVLARQRGEGGAARGRGLEREELGEPLHRVHRVRVHGAGRLARGGAQPIDAGAAEDGAGEPRCQEGQQHQGESGAVPAEDDDNGAGDQHRHQGGRDRVREEVLHQLDVLRGHADEIAAAAAHEIRGRQTLELPEQLPAHPVEEAIRGIVGEPGLRPVEKPRHRRHHRQRRDEVPEGLPAPHRRHHQRSQHAHADERGDADHAQHEGGGEPWRLAPRLAEQHRQRPRPGQGSRGDEIVGGRGLRRRDGVGRGRVVVEDQAIEGRSSHADLSRHQPRVDAGAREQRGMGARLDHAPLVEDQDAVGADHAREPVRDHQRGPAHHEPVERLLHEGLALRVHRGERLVQHQDGRVAEERARDGDTLALAAREADRALAHTRGVALRQAANELVGIRRARRRLQLGARGRGPAEAEIFLHRAVEEIGVLAHHRDVAAHLVGREGAEVAPAESHRAPLRVMEAEQQAHQSGLARAARPHDAHALARRHLEDEPVQRGASAARIAKVDRVERHRRRKPRGAVGARRRVGYFRPQREEREDALGGGAAQHALVEQGAQLAQGTEHLHAQHQDHQEGGQPQLAVPDAIGAPRQRRRRPHRQSHVGDAARQRIGAEHPHGALEEGAALRGQPLAPGAALPEGLERAQPLDGVEQLGAQRGIVPRARQAAGGIAPVPENGGDQREERGRQHDQGDAEVEDGHRAEDEQRRQPRHEELGQVLAEVHLELLHALD